MTETSSDTTAEPLMPCLCESVLRVDRGKGGKHLQMEKHTGEGDGLPLGCDNYQEGTLFREEAQ